MEWLIFVSGVVLGVMAGLSGMARTRNALRAEERTRREAQEASGKRLATLERSLAEGDRLVEEAGKQVEASKTELQLQLDRNGRLFEALEAMERQRNEWKDLYHQAVSGHATAQEMLLAELSRVSRVAKAEVRPHLRDMVGGYRQKLADQEPAASEPEKIR